MIGSVYHKYRKLTHAKVYYIVLVANKSEIGRDHWPHRRWELWIWEVGLYESTQYGAWCKRRCGLAMVIDLTRYMCCEIQETCPCGSTQYGVWCKEKSSKRLVWHTSCFYIYASALMLSYMYVCTSSYDSVPVRDTITTQHMFSYKLKHSKIECHHHTTHNPP